jgi:hypothetical protein
MQLCPGSNKFLCLDKLGNTTDEGCKAFMALNLALTCRQIYSETAGEKLFYKYNRFNFNAPAVAKCYLCAITVPRMEAIASIQLRYDWIRSPAELITLLEACEGLKDLKIDISIGGCNFIERGGIRKLRGFAKLDSIRGLKNFEVTFNSDYGLIRFGGFGLFTDPHELRRAFNNEIVEMKKLMTQPRVKHVSRAKFLQVVSTARLSVPGINRMETGPIGRQTRSETTAREKIRY